MTILSYLSDIQSKTVLYYIHIHKSTSSHIIVSVVLLIFLQNNLY